MSLMRPNSDLRDQLDRIFTDITEELGFPTAFRADWKPLQLLPESGKRAWLLPVEVSETESDYIVKVEVPGMKPEDIQVEVLGNIVTIQGETRQEKQENKQNIHRSEFRYGQFYRQIPLPNNIKSESSRAEFHNGVLELTLPKQEESKHKRLKIDVKVQK